MERRSSMMAILNLKILASLLQMHGPNATIQSDHQGIDAILGDIRGQLSNDTAPAATLPPDGITEVAFRRSAFVKGAPFRRGGFVKSAFRRF
jgi:hypothetical protein